MNENCSCEDLKLLQQRMCDCETRLHSGDVTFAIINTKLTAIIWLLCVVGTSLTGVLIKLMFTKSI